MFDKSLIYHHAFRANPVFFIAQHLSFHETNSHKVQIGTRAAEQNRLEFKVIDTCPHLVLGIADSGSGSGLFDHPGCPVSHCLNEIELRRICRMKNENVLPIVSPIFVLVVIPIHHKYNPGEHREKGQHELEGQKRLCQGPPAAEALPPLEYDSRTKS